MHRSIFSLVLMLGLLCSLAPAVTPSRAATIVFGTRGAAGARSVPAEPSDLTVTGPSFPGSDQYDAVITALMAKWKIPGGSIAVADGSRLVLAHGYGSVDSSQGLPAQPDSLYRVASLTKPLTAAAILRLVDLGELSLDDQAFSILSGVQPSSGSLGDPRLADVTVRELLEHAGGWNRDTTFDPMFAPAGQ